MRVYAEGLTHAPKPLRLFYAGPCYRYERPQKGRYREFFQFGAELIGSPNPESDAEIIALAVRCIESAGLRGTQVRVGQVGALRELLAWMGVTGPLASKAFPLIDKGEMTGLEELLGLLTGEEERFPTAALARIAIPLKTWKDLDPRVRGKLMSLWRPKEVE